MAELDRVREKIAYLKLWQGIMVVTAVSLIGWLVSQVAVADRFTVTLAVAVVVLLTIGILKLHRQIDRRIDQTSRL